MSRRPMLAATGGLVLVLALAGCGVPTSGGPKALSHTLVPGKQFASTPTTTPPDDVPVTIFLLNAAGQPTPVYRAAPPKLDDVSTVLHFLLEGPQSTDPAGITTDIPSATQLLSVDPNAAAGSVPSTPVVVNLSPEFTQATGTAAVLEVAQVVFTISCTLTPSTGSARVLFQIDGVPLDVPIGNGTPTSGPVTAFLYDNGTLPSCVPS